MVTEAGDLLKIYAVLGAMLVLGVGALALLLRNLRLHQAVKLGEEQ